MPLDSHQSYTYMYVISLKGQQREMVFRLSPSHVVQIERILKFVLLVSEDIHSFVSLSVFSMYAQILSAIVEILCTANNTKFAVFSIFAQTLSLYSPKKQKNTRKQVRICQEKFLHSSFYLHDRGWIKPKNHPTLLSI